MNTLTVSLGQMNVRKGQPRTNWGNMQKYTARAVQHGADALVLQELWDAGDAFDRSQEIASSLSGGLFAQVAALARQQNLHIFGSNYEKRGMGVFNTIAVVSPQSGILGAYRKVHLFKPSGEDRYITSGQAPLALDLPWGRTGFAICYDLRFPELFRRYVDDRAEVVIVPCAWPNPRLDHYRTLLRARAIENQCYLIAVNRTGEDEDTGTRFFGHSMVVDPWGEIVLEVGEPEGVYTVTLDLERVNEVRRTFPVLDDRRL